MPLCQASAHGHLETVEFLLERGANVDCSEGGRSSLYYSCAGNHLDIARCLCENGADVNFRFQYDGTTALFCACEQNHVEVAEFLLSRGADVEQGDLVGAFPLWVACKNNNVHVATLLLDHGAEIDRRGFAGRTSLYVACQFKVPRRRDFSPPHAQPPPQFATVKTLLSRGACWNIEDIRGHSPLKFFSEGNLVVGWRLLKLYAFGRKNRFNKYVSRHIRAFLIGEVNALEED